MYLLETLTRTKKEEKKKDFPQWSVLVGSIRSTSNKESTYTANIIECSHMFRSYVNIDTYEVFPECFLSYVYWIR